MIKVNIIKDSICNGKRITTFVLTYPRYIHSEFMTHRVFSRNASSSRAIPTKTILKNILKNPATPESWGLNQPGMQAYSTAGDVREFSGRLIWKIAGLFACLFSYMLYKLGFHKQIVNRLTEPFSHITVICTSTDFNNFFGLRIHHAAQPEIYVLASKMYIAMKYSTPQILEPGEWHLPFVDSKEGSPTNIINSVACCARVSYLNHDKTTPTDKDNLKLYLRLLGNAPIHASPAEHQAEAVGDDSMSGNFKGWLQFRKILKDECIKVLDTEMDLH